MQLTLRAGAKGLETRVNFGTDKGTKNCLFVLSNNKDINPAALDGVTTEYMIVRQLGAHPTGFVVEPVTADYDLVTHRGFECAGSMCRTTARTIHYERPMITPGRCENLLPVAENVNSRFNNKADTPLTPGLVYVRKGEQRAAGIARLKDVDFDRMAAASRYLNRCAAYERGVPIAA